MTKAIITLHENAAGGIEVDLSYEPEQEKGATHLGNLATLATQTLKFILDSKGPWPRPRLKADYNVPPIVMLVGPNAFGMFPQRRKPVVKPRS